MRVGSREVSPLPEELLKTDVCWERKSQVSNNPALGGSPCLAESPVSMHILPALSGFGGLINKNRTLQVSNGSEEELEQSKWGWMHKTTLDASMKLSNNKIIRWGNNGRNTLSGTQPLIHLTKSS